MSAGEARAAGGPSLQRLLNASEEMFRLLVSNVSDYAIFMLDPEGRVASWNEGAARIKGYTADEIIGQHFSTFYPEADKKAGKPDWELVVASDVGRFEDEGWRVRKDGTVFWANVVITALRGADGELRGFGKVTRDLTARREAEIEKVDRERREADALRVHAARLEQLEQAKTEFLNLASHELRGPLSVARGYLSMLLDGSLTAEQFTSYAPLVGAKLGQIEQIVQRMLETARLEYETLALDVAEFDLVPILAVAVEAVRPLLTAEHWIDHQVLVDGPVMVRADAERIAAAISNLLDNAIKYSPAGGPIEVRVTTRNGRSFISIADGGIGISADDMPKLFTRFGRLSAPANIGGTGLGLYLSREIVRRHGGDILVESRPDEGSRFTIVLPLLSEA